jgi:hypothetical protein
LGNIAARSGLEHAFAELVLRICAQDKHGDPWLRPLQITEKVDAVSPRHGDIQNYQIPVMDEEVSQNLVSIFSFNTDYVLYLSLHNFDHAAAYGGMVIGEQHIDHRDYFSRAMPQEP